MNVDLSLGTIISGNPYLNFFRKALDVQVSALSGTSEQSERETARLQSLHPMQVVMELTSLAGQIVQSQWAARPELRLYDDDTNDVSDDNLATLYGKALRVIMLGVMLTTPPEQEIAEAAEQLHARSGSAVTDPGGVAAFLADMLSHTTTPSPLMYVNALMSLLMSAAYAGVSLDDILNRYTETMPKRSLLVTS